MPAFDVCHDQVVRALEKAGWAVTRRHLRLHTKDRTVFVDVYAERGANGSSQRLLLSEIKCFNDPNRHTTDLYEAIGQYLVYRAVIEEQGSPIPLYLAVPLFAFETVFEAVARRVLREYRIKMIVFDGDSEMINQ